jgi:hypothetical protein
MIQEVLTIILIAAAAGYVLYSFYRIVVDTMNRNQAGCPGCTACATKTSPPRSYSSGSGSVTACGASKVSVPQDSAFSGLEGRLQ